MEQPEGFPLAPKGKVLRLLKALYGLKQSGLEWWKTISSSVESLGFKRLIADAGIFIYRHNNTVVVIVVYVDDALFIGNDITKVLELKKKFMKKWECCDLGEVKEYLCMSIKKNGSKISLDQMSYLDKVLERFNITEKPVNTPLPAGYKPSNNESPVDKQLQNKFQQIIGSLLYIMLGTRPDIAFAVTQLASHAANPSQDHYNKALYICRYLLGTRKYSLNFDGKSNKGLEAFVDSDWGSDPKSRRSITDYFFWLANGIISWQSKAQKTIALSSTEAEYMALSDCSRQAIWISTLLREIGLPIKYIPIAGDNQGSIFIASNPVQERRTKHIDIRYHYIRQTIQDGKIKVFFIDGAENPADMFTKNLAVVKFQKFRSQLGLEFH